MLDALRDSQSQNKDLNRHVNELTNIRIQLEGDRDSLASELADHKDALKDSQLRLDAANATLSQLRSEMEHRLREKDDEIENIRWVTYALYIYIEMDGWIARYIQIYIYR